MKGSDTSLRFVDVHGYRRAFRIAGSGPAILLLHGIGDNSQVWAPTMERLAERYTVIAPDLLGHGMSDRPRADYSVAAFANGMRDLLTYLGIERVTLVGHSLGGGVAGQFCYQYPELVERVVFVAAGGVSHEVALVLRALSLPFSEYLVAGTHLPGAMSALAAALAVLHRIPHPALRDAAQLALAVERMPDRTSPEAFGRTLRSVVDWRGQVVTMLDRCYLTAALPTLIVWGTEDSIIPAAHGEMLHSAIQGSRLERFTGAGHFPFLEQPEHFHRVLTDFLDDTTPVYLDAHDMQAALRRGITEQDIAGDSVTRALVLEEIGGAERSAT